MSQRFIRCGHCGLNHEGHVTLCPTTGLRIERHEPARRHQRARQRSPESPERLIGWVLDGKYRIRKLIGEGGMSAIYEADHLGLDRVVAIKVLNPTLADDPEAIARLRHEALVVSAIGHPNICEVFDLGRTADGSPYLVMERLVGESLAERVQHFGPMPFGELAPLMVQILTALESAHEKGILHRDLKPENVFVEQGRKGRPNAKLLDFGISKSIGYEFADQVRLTHTGMVMGTPYYMAPEQARGDSTLDQRVDLWAVGVIMYEVLTGRRPFVATNYNALLVKILTSRPRPVQKLVPATPDAVAALVDKAVSKLREDRFQTAREFRKAVQEVQRQVVAEDPHQPTMMMRRPRAHNLAQTRPDKALDGRDWSIEIEDPQTFIDDEEIIDESKLPQASVPHDTTPEGHPPAQAASWDDDLDEPEETIADRARDPWVDDGDTDRDIAGPRRRDTPLPTSANTDVLTSSDFEVLSEGKVRPRRRDGRSDEDQTTLYRGPRPAESDAGSKPAEDEEKTTLYDVDAANAALRKRRSERGEGGEG